MECAGCLNDGWEVMNVDWCLCVCVRVSEMVVVVVVGVGEGEGVCTCQIKTQRNADKAGSYVINCPSGLI